MDMATSRKEAGVSDDIKRCDHGKLCSEACEVCDTLVSSVAIEALIAERDLLRRRVEVLARAITEGDCDYCPIKSACDADVSDATCEQRIEKWSIDMAMVKKGGG